VCRASGVHSGTLRRTSDQAVGAHEACNPFLPHVESHVLEVLINPGHAIRACALDTRERHTQKPGRRDLEHPIHKSLRILTLVASDIGSVFLRTHAPHARSHYPTRSHYPSGGVCFPLTASRLTSAPEQHRPGPRASVLTPTATLPQCPASVRCVTDSRPRYNSAVSALPPLA
jgi:hypothetical protein